MSEPIFYKAQKVGCLLFGEGVVRCIREIPTAFLFPLEVLFEDGIGCRNYTMNGSYFTDSRPTLYPIEQYRAIIEGGSPIRPPQPEAWKPKVGEWYWFWDTISRYKYAVLSTLESYHANDQYPFATAAGTRYKNCSPFTGEFPEHLKEVTV